MYFMWHMYCQINATRSYGKDVLFLISCLQIFTETHLCLLLQKMSVLNLFDLGQSIHNPNALLQRYVAMRQDRDGALRSAAPVNTADPSRQEERPHEGRESEVPVASEA